MKNRFALIAPVLLCLCGTAMFAQAQANFDRSKSTRDLEVMRGILRTTIDFVIQQETGSEESERQTRGRVAGGVYGSYSNVSAYYLVGQGAVFMIPASGLSTSRRYLADRYEIQAAVMAEQQLKMSEEVAKATAEAAKLAAELTGKAAAGKSTGEAPVPTPKVVVSPLKEEELRQKMTQLQERMKKEQESLEQRRAKFQQSLALIKGALVEALANHGDSLSQVKPGEYITIIISADERLLSQSQVLSVQKSVISDYKAGRLSLDAFRAKVLDYGTGE